MFNLKQTELYRAIESEKDFKTFSILRKIFFIFFLIFLALLIFNFFNSPVREISSWLVGFVLIFLTPYLWLRTMHTFFEEEVKVPRPVHPDLFSAINDQNANLAEWLNFNSAKYLAQSFKLAEKVKLLAPPSAFLLYSLLDEKNPKIIFLFSRLGISLSDFKKQLATLVSEGNIINDSDDFGTFIYEASQSAIRRQGTRIKEGDLISALSESEPNFKKIITDLELGREDLENVSWWIESVNKKIKSKNTFGNYENLIKKGTLGHDLTYGYTPTLDQFSIDWTNIVGQRGYEEIIGNKTEIELTEKILGRKGPRNVLIVGEIGSGRKSIIHSVIKKSLLQQSSPEVNNKRFVQLDIVSLSSNIDSYEKTETIINKCLNEAVSAGNIVLIINDLHDFLGAEKKAGIMDISGILLPYLTDPRMQSICLTTFQGLHKYIEAKPAILSVFEKIEIPEISPKETMLILENLVFRLEKEYGKFIVYESLKEIIDLSGKYVSTPFPQKAISLLQDAFTYSSQFSETDLILPEHIDQILSQKTKIPLGRVKSQEKETLLNLESALHKRVISQEDAIKEISSAMRRARSGVQTKKGPMGGFLFLGPTGVGKTETAKALAEIYFGSEDKMIRLDMSEFQRIEDIARLLGTETQPGILTTKVRENPFSLVLLDEIEKAYPDILNIFLQVLDEGYVNDNFGNKVNFSNTIIIATSNAGYKIILQALKENKEMPEIKKELLDYVFANNLFRPEFVNRFDGVVVFKSLSESDLKQIAALQLNKIADNLKKKKISMIITDELKEKIVKLGFHPIFGAREMKRVIQDNVENAIAKALLSDKISPGDSIEIKPVDFEVKVMKK